jgi:hypothetical protein
MMNLKVKISMVYNCSLERAFKTPLLCDISKVHTGYYGLMPKVTHCTEDENWGQVGATKKVHTSKSLTQKGGFAAIDTILERVENKYWKFELGNFQSWMFGFSKFTGEWQTTSIDDQKVLIDYTYTLHAENVWLYPLNWLFANFFWKTYMKRVIINVKEMAYNDEHYQYN